MSGISSNAVAKDCVFRRNGKSGALARMCGTFAVTSCSSCRNTGPAYAVQGSISSAQLKACEGVCAVLLNAAHAVRYTLQRAAHS